MSATYTDCGNYIQALYTTKGGKVHFKFQKLPGCCGVALLFDVSFLPDVNTQEARENLYKRFHKYVMASKGHFQIRRCILMMTDYDGGEISECCRLNGWNETPPVFNVKSGNNDIVFTIKKTPSTVTL